MHARVWGPLPYGRQGRRTGADTAAAAKLSLNLMLSLRLAWVEYKAVGVYSALQRVSWGPLRVKIETPSPTTMTCVVTFEHGFDNSPLSVSECISPPDSFEFPDYQLSELSQRTLDIVYRSTASMDVT